MHDCDKDERIKALEDRLKRKTTFIECIKAVLTPKLVIAIALGISIILQVMRGG